MYRDLETNLQLQLPLAGVVTDIELHFRQQQLGIVRMLNVEVLTQRNEPGQISP